MKSIEEVKAGYTRHSEFMFDDLANRAYKAGYEDGYENGQKQNIEPGQTIKAYGHEWEVLDCDSDKCLCLMKEFATAMAFSEDDNNDYAKSDIRAYLEKLTRELEEKGAEFKDTDLDLTADDGTGWDKEELNIHGLFLLTADMYRKYRRYITNKDSWWWLATAYSFAEDYHHARIVNTDDTLGYNSAYYGDFGVSPACYFSISCLEGLEEPENEKQEEPNKSDDIKVGDEVIIYGEYGKRKAVITGVDVTDTGVDYEEVFHAITEDGEIARFVHMP